MKSLGQKIMQLSGLIGTNAVNDWESEFIQSIVWKTQCGVVTTKLSPKQAEAIDKIYGKHFA